MLAPEHVQLARRFLVDADKELEAGDVFQASEKLWGAASHVVIAEMHRRGIKQSGYKVMINALESFADDYADDPTLGSLFTSAETLHANFYHGFLDSDDLPRFRDRVHQFVNRMIELTNGQSGIEN